MKKFLALLLAASLPISAAAETYYAFCRPDSTVNMRFAPSSKSSYEGYLVCGEPLEVSETIYHDKRGRAWYQSSEMKCEAGTVYVCAAYLSDTPVTIEDGTVTVTAKGRVAIRSTPGGKRIRWAHKGDRLHVLAYSSDWALVDHGYIKMDCIDWVKEETP